MLFEMTSTLSCWASMPVAAISIERMSEVSVLALGDLAELLDGRARAVALAVAEILGETEIVGDVHHPGHLDDRLDVGFFDHALLDDGLGRRRRHRLGDVETARGRNEVALVGEADGAHLAGFAVRRGYGAAPGHRAVRR